MTADNKLQLYRTQEYSVYAGANLSAKELEVLEAYLTSGGMPLAPEPAARFFELFLAGSDVHEIHRLNKAFPLGALLDAQVKFKWNERKDKYASDLQDKVLDKVRMAQLETTELMTDILAAARRKYGDKLKKYIQSGNDADLDGVIDVSDIKNLVKLTEGLLKITGQDRVQKVKTEDTQNVNINLNGNNLPVSDLDPESAAQILQIISDSKRKKNASQT